MRFWLLIGFLMMPGMLKAETSFDDVQILERDEARIKATGDLRGGEKLMKVVARFRDADMMVLGNDYRYEYVIVIPYVAITSLTYSDIGGHLPDNLHRAAPLYESNFDGQDQRWFEIQYKRKDQTETVLLMLDEDTAGKLLTTLEGVADKAVERYVDGLPYQVADAVFRECRVFRTVIDDKGKSETDDFPCLVIMDDDAFRIVGQDDDYQEQLVVSYADVRGLFYEHSKETSFMGRLPGIGAFRKAKHWFVIEGAGTTALVLEPDIVADFREVAQAKTNISINSYVQLREQAPAQASVLPEALGGQPQEEMTVEGLMSARAIRCLLGPGTRARWAQGKLDRKSDTRYDDEAPELFFDEIDLKTQTATLHQAGTQTVVRVVASDRGITFLSVDNATFVTTVFARRDGQLVCVHSHHVTGEEPLAGQFYGVAEIVKE